MLLKLTALGTLVRRCNHQSYQGGPKSPPDTFVVLTNSGRFDLETSLCLRKSHVSSKRQAGGRDGQAVFAALSVKCASLYRYTDLVCNRVNLMVDLYLESSVPQPQFCPWVIFKC